MANDVTWDTDSIPVAEGFYVSNTIRGFMEAQTEQEAIDAIGAAGKDAVNDIALSVNSEKQPAGGIYCDQAGGAVVPISINDLAQGGTQSFSLGWVGKTVASAAINVGTLFGSTRGTSTYNSGSASIAVSNDTDLLSIRTEDGTGVRTHLVSTVNARTAFHAVVLTYDGTTKEAEMYVDGVSVGTQDWSNSLLNSPHLLKIMQSTTSINTIDNIRSPAGYTTAVAAWAKALTATEAAEWSASGGKIMPISARADCACHITCDDGIGPQLRDSSGNVKHALATATGVDHLILHDDGSLRASNVNASTAMYLLRAGDVLPVGAVVTQVIIDGECQIASCDQTRTLLRIRLNPDNYNLQVQRSDGTDHETLAEYTPVSLANCDVRITYTLNN